MTRLQIVAGLLTGNNELFEHVANELKGYGAPVTSWTLADLFAVADRLIEFDAEHPAPFEIDEELTRFHQGRSE